ncbi:MAG: lipoate--protein ligase family protein [Candidatus Bipolaricaulota bacterium]|nr:lipoate--protein ligase family protein [Candidatus Bipolaricaulota bacterium]
MRLLLDLAFRPPGLNLALDEAILASVARDGEEPALRIWRNGRCVVVGRGQRAEDEADLASCARLRIPVLSRASGGGTVYHHPGNLNFSLFLPLVPPWTSVRESQGELAFLLAAGLRERFGIEARAEGGAVFVGRLKVSGSAQLRRRALLHHGTLLFAPDTVSMEDVLRAHRPGYRPRGVPSHPAPVGDLSSLLEREVALEEAVGAVIAAFRPLGEPEPDELSLREWALADALAGAARA